MSDFHKLILSGTCLLCVFCFAGCSSTKDKSSEAAPQGKFMQNDRSRTHRSKSFAETMDGMMEKRKEERSRFKDVNNRLDYGNYHVFPWRNSSSPRSEQLHEKSLINNTIYY